jgi:hypothetical protein
MATLIFLAAGFCLLATVLHATSITVATARMRKPKNAQPSLPRSVMVWMLRDLLLPVLRCAGRVGTGFVWPGNAVPIANRSSRAQASFGSHRNRPLSGMAHAGTGNAR